MGDISKSAVFDCGKNRPRQWTTLVGMERRTEKAPNGHVERMVDPQGNVVFVQLLQPAALRQGAEHVDAARAKHVRKGFITHARCPLTSGQLSMEDMISAGMPAELRAYCEPGSYGANRPCRHVKYVIEFRQAEQAAKMKLMDDQFFAEKRGREALEKAKVDATDRLNARIAELLERVLPAAAPAAAPPEPAASTAAKRGKETEPK